MKVKIIFAPIPDSPNLTFVEVEDMDGHSVSVGEWLPKDGAGFVALVLELAEPELLEQRDELLEVLNALLNEVDVFGLLDELDADVQDKAVSAIANATKEAENET